jgi:hypothetical protein
LERERGQLKKFWTGILLTLLIASARSQATTIDFEAQAGGATPTGFNNHVDSQLTIGVATFRGGELLKNEAGGTDKTAVYATLAGTTSPYPAAGYLNPITITFSQAVSAFSLILTNNLADTYTVSDNQGGTQSLALSAGVSQLFTLNDTGITSVSIGASDVTLDDFAIDNVLFTQGSAPATAPEPGTLWVLLTLLVAVVLTPRRRAAAHR